MSAWTLGDEILDWAERNLLGDNRETLRQYGEMVTTLERRHAELQDEFTEMCRGSIAASESMRAGILSAVLSGRVTINDEEVGR